MLAQKHIDVKSTFLQQQQKSYYWHDSPSSVTEAHVLEINPSFGEQQVSCIHIILYLQQRGIWKLCMYNRTQETRRKAWHWADSELSKPDECIKTETMEKILRPLSSQIQESVCKLAPTAFANI